jgi:hypothetical protein
MRHHYFLCGGRAAGLLASLWLLATTTWAQAPAWSLAVVSTNATGPYDGQATGVATDKSGNIFVTGTFTGNMTFGSKVLTSAGGRDLFVAKYVPRTNTWAWAYRGGGTANDGGNGIATSGGRVYITGSLFNTSDNINNVQFGSAGTGTTTVQVPVRGATSSANGDLLVACYVDNDTTATLKWTQVDGGSEGDIGYAIAVRDTSVYVAGFLTNNLTNDARATFGATATAPGTVVQLGTSAFNGSDILLAKYTDTGPAAALVWTQIAGGSYNDEAYGLAVQGNDVYLTGSLVNNNSNGTGAVFGGTGTVPGTVTQYGASNVISNDILVAKYTDNGATATLRWTQTGGGNNTDYGHAIAVNGPNVYVTGEIYARIGNVSQVVFGGTGTTLGATEQDGASYTNGFDLVVAKYTDNGSSATFGWSQVGGGTDWDGGRGLAVNGPHVYVTGYLRNNATNANSALFGGAGILPGAVSVAGASSSSSLDVVVAKYTDNGATATLGWTQVGGGTGSDVGAALAVGPAGVYVAGQVTPTATFGSLTLSAPTGGSSSFLGSFTGAVLATAPAVSVVVPQLYPNPSSGLATLSGAAPGAAVHILDALGRCVAITTASTSGAASLPKGLPAGLYLVRAGAATLRWTVE